ncbi:MAG: M3 family oligoendopeptidase, partial [Ktedonobacterales bacterium]
MSSAAALPRWDVSGVFPSLESPEFAAGFTSASAAIDGLAALFDEERIAAREPAPLDDATVRAVERVLARYNAVLDE